VPPACNTGVHPHDPAPSPGSRSHFDWYRATVPASVELLTQVTMELAGKYAQIEEGKGRFNYLRSRVVSAGGDRVATILYGGSNGHPNIEASGNRAPALAAMLRAGGPHRVTRCDVAVDLYGEGLFDELGALATSIAREQGLCLRRVSNPIDRTAGDTVYLGSRKSVVFARIYEKGKADRRAYSDDHAEVLHGWVRCELEVKPQKEMKSRAAFIEPDEFWGISAWTAQLASEALSMSPDPLPFHPRRLASDERAYRFAIAQYRAVLWRRLRDVFDGDRAAFMRSLEEDIFTFDEAESAA
jgi:hypothetical protein